MSGLDTRCALWWRGYRRRKAAVAYFSCDVRNVCFQFEISKDGEGTRWAHQRVYDRWQCTESNWCCISGPDEEILFKYMFSHACPFTRASFMLKICHDFPARAASRLSCVFVGQTRSLARMITKCTLGPRWSSPSCKSVGQDHFSFWEAFDKR